MNYVLDTNVLKAAVRSPSGASAEILRRVLLRQVGALCSVPLFMEYEAVLLRPEHLAAAGAHADQVINLLDALAGVVIRVEIQFLWRPQLRDPNDDLVLELAVNGQGVGDSVAIEPDMGTQSNYALRLPLSLKAGAEQLAREDGTTLNQFIVSAVAEKLSAMKTADYFAQRAKRGDVNAALAFLSRQGGQAPEEQDVLPS
eukprot:gene16181-18469_t